MDRQEAIVLLGYKLAAMKEMAEEDWQMYDEEGGEQWEDALQTAIAALRAQEEAEKNKPLTLDELRKMEGEPVWLETGEVSIGEQIVGQWAIIHSLSDTFMVLMGGGNGLRLDNYGKTWLAYHHKPKEVNHETD